MKARKTGTIITISSSAARRPHPQSPIPYAAAKASIQCSIFHLRFLHTFTRMYEELAHD